MPKDAFAAVERRYKFRLPELYRSMSACGHFDPKNDSAQLTFSDFEWLTPQAIAELEFLDWQAAYKTWFVPFAISGRHDQWGWRLDWAAEGEPPVVFCEWGPEGYGYASDFRAFLYRLLLEELSGTWLLEDAADKKGQQMVARSIEVVLPLLAKPWAARLKKLAKLPWQKHDGGTIGVFPRSECEKIVAKELGFPHLNEKFWQEDPPKRAQEEKPKSKALGLPSGTKPAQMKKPKSKPAKKQKSKKATPDVRSPLVVAGPDPAGFGGTMAGQTRDDNGLKMVFCWCPPGTFQMGSPASESGHGDDEGPVQVTLTHGFWLGKFEVTQEEFQRLTGTHRATFTSSGSGKAAVVGLDTSRFPIEGVTWDEAIEICQRFTQQEQKAGRLPDNWEYRLPTEAQWEYACRAGSTTATSFGDNLSSKQANFDGSAPYHRAPKGRHLARPTTVGSYAANAWGLYDMHGNVREFCRDAAVPQLPGGTDPESLPARPICQRAVRGGSWRSEGDACRSAFRYGMINTVFDDDLGFRVACVRSH